MESTFRMMSIVPILAILVFVGTFVTILVVILRAASSHRSAYNTIASAANAAARVQQATRTVYVVNRTAELLPLVTADIPSFSWEEVRTKAKNALRAKLIARTTENPSLLPEEASEELKRQLALEIADDRAGGVIPKYADIKVCEAEISDYANRGGVCNLTVQAKVRCRKWDERDGRLVSGNRDRETETVFLCQILLLRDLSRAEDFGFNLNCPGCGGRITNVQAKYCEYCGRPLSTSALRFGEIREI